MKPQSEPQRVPLPSRSSYTLTTTGRLGESVVAILRERQDAPSGLLIVASSDRKAEEIVRLLQSLAPDLSPHLFPGWDCLPYDRASPSRSVMGRRLSVLKALSSGLNAAPVVVTSPLGILQRIPPTEELIKANLVLKPGDKLDREQIAIELEQLGYVFDERVDEPGEVALRGQVMDIFPAGIEGPVRVEHRDGRIVAMRLFDPVTQIASGECAELNLLPASEHFITGIQAEDIRTPGSEHYLPEHFARLDTLFALLPDARLLFDVKAEERVSAIWAQIQDAYENRMNLRPERAEGKRPLAPDRLYLAESEWNENVCIRTVCRIEAEPDNADLAPPPLFAARKQAFRHFGDFVRHELERDQKVVLIAGNKAEQRRLTRALPDDIEHPVEDLSHWGEVEQAESRRVVCLSAVLDKSFRDKQSGCVVIAAADVLGRHAQGSGSSVVLPTDLVSTELTFRIDDVVVHQDYGLGVLKGIESIETEGHAADLLRLNYADDATLMLPVDEMGSLWRYGASVDAVTLDRIDGDAWEKRRVKVEAEIAESAVRLAEAVKARETETAAKLSPSRALYERFAAGFPYTETPDQTSAIAAVLEDIASGHPMNRLVCGDVGFGKTEVALRAAAAAALAGKQVAIVAPTTVLVRQHVQTFERRFASLNIKIGHLSRLVSRTEAKAVKSGIADGSIRIVIGTHALAGKGIRFADLGLVIIDEEQRFGAAHKTKIRALAKDAHVLTLTATPIPRTLQAALVGLQDISIIATPPTQRQPIRTFVIPFDEATVREALLRERRRGGQSFVVCPRIEDIEPMAKRLEALVPELQTVIVHGSMPAEEIDEAMVRFADGEGDVLLATNIIESGLDVSRANTMLVWRPDRFGLSQLHQLRGRVGRGRLRGVAYLLTDPAHHLGRSTRKRLETLESLDRLGAGFAISANDLDQRGAGDLFGEDQAGHIKLIGVSLYQNLLIKALGAASSEGLADDRATDLNMDVSGHIPADYVPEAEVRINLYARLARLESEEDVEAFEDEIRNRFGEPPTPVNHLIALARIRAQGRRYAIARIDAGPQAIALSFKDGASQDLIKRIVTLAEDGPKWQNGRLVWSQSSESAEERLSNVMRFFRLLAKGDRSS